MQATIEAAARPIRRGGRCVLNAASAKSHAIVTQRHASGGVDMYRVVALAGGWTPQVVPHNERLVQVCLATGGFTSHISKCWRDASRANTGMLVHPLRAWRWPSGNVHAAKLIWHAGQELARDGLRCDAIEHGVHTNPHVAPACGSIWASACASNASVLTPSAAARGSELFGATSGLGCVRSLLHKGGASTALTVATLGGSISAGGSWIPKGSLTYHAQLVSALRLRHPRAVITHHNGALSATGPVVIEHCINQQLPAEALAETPEAGFTLVLIEFAINLDGEPAAFERLLRRVLLRRRVSVVVVNAHHWRPTVNNGQCAPCYYDAASQVWNGTDEDAVATICKHYALPLVSLRAALFDGRHLIAARRVLSPEWPGELLFDDKHVNELGHTYLAQLILARLLHDEQSIGECATSLGPPRLPPPLLSEGDEGGTHGRPSVCARGVSLSRYVLASRTRGFAMSDEGRGKPGLVGRAPGARVALLLANGSAAATIAPGVVRLGYLRSYVGMGRAAVSCSGTCRCAERIDALDAGSKTSVTLQQHVRLQRRSATGGGAEDRADARARRCVLHVTIQQQTSATASAAGAHKFKVMALMWLPR